MTTVKTTLFANVPQPFRRAALGRPLLVEGQKAFLASRAPHISNPDYWRKTVEEFEKGKLDKCDATLDPHVSELIRILGTPNKSIIEYGCGIGRTADLFFRSGFTDYLGIDIAERAIELATQRTGRASFHVGDILNYSAGTLFDAAVATDVLLYLSPEDQIRALINIGTSLVPGAFVLTRWAPGDELIGFKKKPLKPSGFIEGWVFHATPGYLRDLFITCGYRLIERPGYKLIHEETLNTGVKEQKYLVVFARFNGK